MRIQIFFTICVVTIIAIVVTPFVMAVELTTSTVKVGDWDCEKPALSLTVPEDSTCTKENHETEYYKLDQTLPESTLMRVGKWSCEGTNNYSKCVYEDHMARYNQIVKNVETK